MSSTDRPETPELPLPPGLNEEELAAVLDAVGDAITVQRPDGTLAWANAAAAELLGCNSVQELLEAPLSSLMDRYEMLDEHGQPFPVERLPGRLALAGQKPAELTMRWRSRGSEQDRWSLVQAAPVLGPDGRVRFAVNVFRDDTERQRALRSLQRSEERLAFLASASQTLLGAALDQLALAERLSEICVPSLGDMCAVWELSPDGRARLIAERFAGGSRSGQGLDQMPGVVRSALRGTSTVADGENAAFGHSSVTVPIPGRTGPVGALLIARDAGRASFSAGDLKLVQELGRRAGAAIENALLYAERSRAADVLARSLVPAELPEVPGLELSAFVRAAASGVGGDFYDVVSMADGRSLLVIADVCGKGPEAAALTAMARYTLRTLAPYYASPGELLRAVNEALVDQLPDGRFCSLACGALGPSPSGIRVTVAVAGHPRPAIVRRSGTIEGCGHTGLPLGIFYRLELEEQDVMLEPGDSFLLVTDGCVGEGSAWESVLHEALTAQAPASAAEMAALVEKVAHRVQPDHPDDIAALVARVAEA